MAFAAFWAAPAAAGLTDPLYVFATCTGRLSAQMEHQWLFQDSAAEQTERQRAAMIDLIDATMHPTQGPDVLNWRIEAKFAHSALLTRATIGGDTWAAERASSLVQGCTSLLLS